ASCRSASARADAAVALAMPAWLRSSTRAAAACSAAASAASAASLSAAGGASPLVRGGGVLGGLGIDPLGGGGRGGLLGRFQVGELGAGTGGAGAGVPAFLPYLGEGAFHRADAEQGDDQAAAPPRDHAGERGQLLLLGADRGEEGALVHADHAAEERVGLAGRLHRELAVAVHLDLGGEVQALEVAADLVGVAFVLEDQLDAEILAYPRRAQLRLVGPRVAVKGKPDTFDQRAVVYHERLCEVEVLLRVDLQIEARNRFACRRH